MVLLIIPESDISLEPQQQVHLAAANVHERRTASNRSIIPSIHTIDGGLAKKHHADFRDFVSEEGHSLEGAGNHRRS